MQQRSIIALLPFISLGLGACSGASEDEEPSDPIVEDADVITGFDGTIPADATTGVSPASCDPSDLSAGTMAAHTPVSPGSSNELRLGAGTPYFSTVAHVSGSACSTDYSDTAFCYNQNNPPLPSIVRPVGSGLRGADDGIANRFGDKRETAAARFESHRPVPGDSTIPPFEFQSADGRLLYTGDWRHWPNIGLFRPELMGYDHTLRDNTDPGYPGDEDDNVDAFTPMNTSIHTLALFNPQDTAYTVAGDGSADPQVYALLGNGQPNFLHTTFCESSSDKVASDLPTNPYPCSARYGTFNYQLDPQLPPVTNQWGDTYQDLEVLDGLCYDVTVIGGTTATAAVANQDVWELHSAPLTLFVASPYSEDAGTKHEEGNGIWVYPRDPEGAVSSTPVGQVVNLPDFAPYHLERLFPWDQVGASSSPNIDSIGTTASYAITGADGQPANVPNQCYIGGNENPSAPAWCDFLFGVETNSELRFDVDLDSTPDRGTAASLYAGVSNNAAENLFEPIVTADGKLMLINSNLGVFYSTSNDPCSALGFESWLPYSMMPNDASVRDHYPVARTRRTAAYPNGEPFRDPYGNHIPFGSIQRFAYPWMDREGKNLFMSAMNENRDAWTTTNVERDWVDEATAADAGVLGTPVVPAGNEDPNQMDHLDTRAGHSVLALGAWTGHKQVLMDNSLNSTDFGGTFYYDRGQEYAPRFVLPLYSDAALAFVPRGATEINSLEHRMNLFDTMRPTLPFDVVWSVQANNQFTTEVAFDELMNPNAFVVAPMNATAKITGELSGKDQNAFVIEDGFLPSGSVFDAAPGLTYNSSVLPESASTPEGRPILQNAAPFENAVIYLDGGARIEPVNMGGVLGRGVYFDGDNDHARVVFSPQTHGDWYYGLWLDARSMTDNDRYQLLGFDDGTAVGIKPVGGQTELWARQSNGTYVTLNAGERMVQGQYHHLGLKSVNRAGARVLQWFVDGSSLGEVSVSSGFDMAGEELALGASSEPASGTHPVKGWVDEFRVTKLRPEDAASGSWFDEFICNSALGTLVDPDLVSSDSRAAEVAHWIEDTVGSAPNAVCEQLVLTSHGRPTDLAPQVGLSTCADKVHRNGSDGDACLRKDRLDLVELTPDAPRPDASNTPFCTSCHHPDTQVLGLRPEALDPGSADRFQDRRRQPMDPPALLALPTAVCDPSYGLDGSWYTAFLTHGQRLDGHEAYTTDHVVDDAVLMTLGNNGRFVTPQ